MKFALGAMVGMQPCACPDHLLNSMTVPVADRRDGIPTFEEDGRHGRW